MSSILINELRKFDIHLEYGKLQEITITDLLNEEKCLAFLHKQMSEIKAPNLAVAASMFSKRYAYLVVSSTLYSMVEFNCALHLPVEACALSEERKLYIQADMCKWQDVNGTGREQWRETMLCALFAEHITPVLNNLQKTTGIPLSILWENIAVRINSIYRKTLTKELESIKIERLNSDFQFLKKASGDLFNLNSNPISDYLKIGLENEMNLCRKTCCMYYKLKKDVEGVQYCSSCPIKAKVSMEERL